MIEFEKFTENIYNTFKKEVTQGEGVGTISELYNSKPPYKPGGTFSQAWSVSEVLKIVLRREN